MIFLLCFKSEQRGLHSFIHSFIMDSNHNNVNDAIDSAAKLFQEGNYKGSIALLEPFLKGEKKKTLSPVQEYVVVAALGKSNELLGNHKAALLHVKRSVELSVQLYGKGSKDHALALNGLGQIETVLKDYKSAKKHFNDAGAIHKELGTEKSAEHGSLLLNRAKVDLDQQRWKEALEGYIKAKAVMENFKEDTNYGVIVNNMAFCYEELNQWTEALQYYREAVELARNSRGDQHPEYATCISNLACAYVCIKQPTIAIRLFEEALVIYKRVYGDKHPITIGTIKELAQARELEKKGRHLAPTIGDVRMCNNCEKVSEEIVFQCSCKKVNYCNEECRD